MNLRFWLFTPLLLTPSIAFAADVKISSVAIKPMTKVHLCRALGGRGIDPQLTIKHDKVAGAKIRIKMYDNVNNGQTVNHYSTTVKSRASGITMVSYNFLAPCNRTGKFTSNYKFEIRSGRSKKKVKWGRYNSITKKIF